MSNIPTAVRNFLYKHIETLEELEVLVLLAQQPERSFTVSEAEEKIRIGSSSLLTAFQSLRRSGLCELVNDGNERAYALVRRDPLLRTQAFELARTHADHRFEIMKLVSEAAMERIRGSMARAFADAFLLGGKKRGDR